METTPLDGYKKIIVTLLTIIAGSLGLFITDPAKAQTVGQFLVDVIGPPLSWSASFTPSCRAVSTRRRSRPPPRSPP